MVNEGRLTHKQRMIAILAATATMQNNEIAEKLGCHANTVTRVLKMPEVQQVIREMQQAVQERAVTDLVEAFDGAALEAFRKLVELMREGPASVAMRAVESVLDRSRLAPKRQIHRKHDVEGRVMHLHLPARQMREIENALKDAGTMLPVPQLTDDEEYAAEIDAKTGEVLCEGKVSASKREE